MDKDFIMSNLSEDVVYSRDQLLQILSERKSSLSPSTFRWILYRLMKEKLLFRVGFDSYSTKEPTFLEMYCPSYSDHASHVMKRLDEQFPGLEYVVFESTALNEFLKHQIAQNTIFIQVTKGVSSCIFDALQEENNERVLYRPTKKELDRYWTRDCIVILDLVSQSPLSSDNPHAVTAEKLLVDIIAEKSIAASFSASELVDIYRAVLTSYHVDRNKLRRYAGRRGKAASIKEYLIDEV